MCDKPTMCATIVPGNKTGPVAARMMESIVGSCYEACRSGRKQLEGFPDVRPLLNELQSLSEGHRAEKGAEDFKVTAVMPGGALVIRNQFFEQFAEVDGFNAVVADHNSRYNTENLTLQVPTAPQPESAPSLTHAETVSTDGPIKADVITSLTDPSAAQTLSLKLDHWKCFHVLTFSLSYRQFARPVSDVLHISRACHKENSMGEPFQGSLRRGSILAQGDVAIELADEHGAGY